MPSFWYMLSVTLLAASGVMTASRGGGGGGGAVATARQRAAIAAGAGRARHRARRRVVKRAAAVGIAACAAPGQVWSCAARERGQTLATCRPAGQQPMLPPTNRCRSVVEGHWQTEASPCGLASRVRVTGLAATLRFDRRNTPLACRLGHRPRTGRDACMRQPVTACVLRLSMCAEEGGRGTPQEGQTWCGAQDGAKRTYMDRRRFKQLLR